MHRVKVSKLDRKKVTNYHQITKQVKTAVEEKKTPLLVVTKLLDQVVLMGQSSIIQALEDDPEKKTMVTSLLSYAKPDDVFASTEMKVLPPLFVDLNLGKKYWTTQLYQAQAQVYLCLLGYGAGGPKNLSSEEEPVFWPEGIAYLDYIHPSHATDQTNIMLIKAILIYCGYDESHFDSVVVPENKKKKRQPRKINKTGKAQLEDQDQDDVELEDQDQEEGEAGMDMEAQYQQESEDDQHFGSQEVSMEGLEDEALLEEALGEEALLEEALGEDALVEDALGEGALEGETLEEDEQTLGFHDQDVSKEDLDFLMDALDEEDGRGQNVAVVEEEEEIHMEKHENLDPGKGNKDQKSLASKTPGKSKKSSLVGAIRKSQRARKVVSFLDYGSDTEEEEMEKKKKRS